MSGILTVAPVVGGLLVGLAGLLAARSRRVRAESFRRTRRAEQDAKADPVPFATTKAWLQVHDALTDTLIRVRLARAYRGLVRSRARLADLRALAVLVVRELEFALKDRSDADSCPAPSISQRQAAIFNYGFLLPGDMVIVSGALTAEDSNLSPLFALVSAAALATAVWFLGKSLGTTMKSEEVSAATIAPPLVALLAIGIALGFLRESRPLLWVALSMAPAIGSAVVAMYSRNPGWDRVVNSEKRLQSRLRQFRRSSRRFGRRSGRAGGAFVNATTRTTSKLIALPNAIAAEVDAATWPEVVRRPATIPPREIQRPSESGLDLTIASDTDADTARLLTLEMRAFFDTESDRLDSLIADVLLASAGLRSQSNAEVGEQISDQESSAPSVGESEAEPTEAGDVDLVDLPLEITSNGAAGEENAPLVGEPS